MPWRAHRWTTDPGSGLGALDLGTLCASASPRQVRRRSGLNPTHQINANWIYELPVGRGHHWASDSNRVIIAIVGGWQLSGIFRWTSGFPWTVDEGSTWPTNWDIEGWAILDKPLPSLKRGSGANAFADPMAVFNAFRVQYPGASV